MSEPGEGIKINFEIPRELSYRLDTFVPWGVKATVFRRIIEMVVGLLSKHGNKALGPLLSGEFELRLKENTTLLETRVKEAGVDG